MKFENEKKDARKLHLQKLDEYTNKIQDFEESLRLAKKNVEEKEMNNKAIVSEHAKAIKRLNDELENRNLMRLKKLRS